MIATDWDADAKDLVAGQVLSIVDADASKDGPVLLSAVAQPASAK